MRYVSKCIPKQMRLHPLPENVGTERQVSEVVRQRVPGHRTGDGECPTDKECWNIRSQDYSFPGTYVPMMELSFSGPFVPWTIRSLDRSFPGPFVPETE